MIMKKKHKKDKIIKELKNEVSDLKISDKNLESQLNRQEQYLCRIFVSIHRYHTETVYSETQDENTDDISLGTINEHWELELTEREVDRTHKIGNPKSGNKKPRPIIVKFLRYQRYQNTRRKVFVNKKVKNTGISIIECLTKHRTELFF